MDINSIPKNTVVFTTIYVIEKKSPIVYVSFHVDGDFYVFSEEGIDLEYCRVISLEDIIGLDPTISLINEIERGEKFYRENIASAWVKM